MIIENDNDFLDNIETIKHNTHKHWEKSHEFTDLLDEIDTDLGI